MKAAEWIQGLVEVPKGASAKQAKEARLARERYVLQAVIAGLYLPIEWKRIVSTDGENTVEMWVSTDALRIGEPDDYVRVTMTQATSQRIDDYLDTRALTSKVCDLIYQQADVQLEPHTQPAAVEAGTMMKNAVLVKHSREVDAELAGRSGLVADVSKDWTLHPILWTKPKLAVNHGWHTKRRPDPKHPEWGPYAARCGGFIWQQDGSKHNAGVPEDPDPGHYDYSQAKRLWHRMTRVNGERIPSEIVVTDKILGPLVSWYGAMPGARHPGLPFEEPGYPLPDPE